MLGYYCVSCERFIEESDIVEGKCPLHPSRELEWVEETNYFFALSKFQEPLLKHIRRILSLSFLHPGEMK